MSAALELQSARYLVRGAVQGVGFRPFVHRLARALGVVGWVKNTPQGVLIAATGTPETLARFQAALAQPPSPARVTDLSVRAALPGDDAGPFTILESDPDGPRTTTILPDLATCDACLREVFDPANRRYLYPFTNCTHCGPRFSIVTGLPYDRPQTTMRGFTQCPACRAEYEQPADRRFHAQPNACPVCGPQLSWWDQDGRAQAARHEALLAAAAAIRAGRIVAMKGLGGFLLLCDARNEDAVRTLRLRKHREEKPFALMFPSLDDLRACCETGELEASLLTSPAAPIVLLKRVPHSPLRIPHSVAPGNPLLGAMLPYTPLHHLLMRDLGFPVVATSGNLSDEPICIEEQEAVERLRGVADGFLVHNRPIARPVDDSVVRVIAGREMILRRARGYAPAPLVLQDGPETGAAIAVGAHLKNTVALRVGRQVFLSQHLGDLDTEPAFAAFREGLAALSTLYPGPLDEVVCDLHPDYLSTRHARTLGSPVRPVQHHVAHVAACMAEHGLAGPVLGVAWDGTGYGTDGTIWGGEFFRATRTTCERIARFRPFPLPGGEKAIREPRRAALGLLYAWLGDDAFARTDLAPLRSFSADELRVLRRLLARDLQSPRTSSAGRLFDVMASLLDLCQVSRFEGQAAMSVEFAAESGPGGPAYPCPLEENVGASTLNSFPLIENVIADLQRGRTRCEIASAFHISLAGTLVTVAKRFGLQDVVLSGGCFQNARLTERAVEALEAAGCRPYWPRQVPPNDGGIALGQSAWAAYAGGRGDRTDG